MADLDKLRALMTLMREFGATKFADSDVTVELCAPVASRNQAATPEQPDPAIATVRRLQEALRTTTLDEGNG